ncbi:polyamine aminopropyltransferase [Puniceicoccus vermicola]|uniref:Polyamine aminopropyltransferase n=1 Tax=Puniceicoccus vermicola TaxID=388746 RepID=A0A7X1B0K3_9BACT|nr:polyamine aminopropyltransferase [Puniceicoccus vermicola]MBC2603374.1 polyamine aminopropyltransferase [Puniceicoccus vermicola]
MAEIESGRDDPEVFPSRLAKHKETSVLIIAVFVAGLCSIVYQLLISATSSYFLGDSVKQFSLTIGLYMASMGCGAWLSRFVQFNLIRNFIFLEIGLGFLGGASVPLLYLCYAAFPDAYIYVMISLSLAIGLLIGFEIPLLTRILERYYSLKLNVSNVLSIDYLGALIATLLFPFVLLPFFGTFRSSLIVGLINLGLGVLMLVFFGRKECRSSSSVLAVLNGVTAIVLVILLVAANMLIGLWSQSLYSDRIIFDQQSRYQKIVLTRYADDIRLFLNGNLQFSSRDEYRYHESLVHVPMAASRGHSQILLLGGGDGMAVRELLKYPDVSRITVVDLDPAVTSLARKNPLLRVLNEDAFEDPKVKIVHQDAMRFLQDSVPASYDVILADLPDPNNLSLCRLYSREFFNLVASRLTASGVFVTQSTSPYFARQAFWTIERTLKESDFSQVLPYHVHVPSFGDWGFNLAAKFPVLPDLIRMPDVSTRFLDGELLARLFHFPSDIDRPKREVQVSTLDDPKLMHAYLKGWNYWR